MTIHTATLRRATLKDQALIRRMVWGARLDPTGLHWSHFIVAETDGEIVGIGQVRPHTPHCRKLGSLVVREDRRGRGIGAQMVGALLAEERGSVYLECREAMASYYTRFGFEEIPWSRAPMPLKLKAGLGNLGARLFGRRLAVMRRPKAAPDTNRRGPAV